MLVDTDLNDAWFTPSTSSQGFFVNTLADIGQMIAAWRTVDTQRPDESITAHLSEPGHRLRRDGRTILRRPVAPRACLVP